MKRTVKEVKGRKYIIEEFTSYNELLNTNDSRTQNFGCARTDTDNRWRGCTYDEAVEMLRYGWEDKDKLSLINNKIKELEKKQEVYKMSFKNDIVGYAPIVPLALRGVPQNMINCTRKPKKAKVVHLIIDIGVTANFSAEEKLNWGAEMVAKIMNLEKQGFRVRIDITKVQSERGRYGTVHALLLPVKNENQPFDIKRLMFPIAHAGMQRRITFDWYERCPEAQELGGYGCSIGQQSKEDREDKVKNIISTENSYLICCMENIDEALKGVK